MHVYTHWLSRFLIRSKVTVQMLQLHHLNCQVTYQPDNHAHQKKIYLIFCAKPRKVYTRIPWNMSFRYTSFHRPPSTDSQNNLKVQRSIFTKIKAKIKVKWGQRRNIDSWMSSIYSAAEWWMPTPVTVLVHWTHKIVTRIKKIWWRGGSERLLYAVPSWKQWL